VVQVRGVVRPYDRTRLETSLGIKLDPGALTDYESRSVLIAHTIDVDVPMGTQAGDEEFSSGSSAYDLGGTIDDILAQPEEFVGLTVSVSGDVEENLLTFDVFLLGGR